MGDQLIESLYVPHMTGLAFKVRRNQLIEVVDIQGKQVCDFFAFNVHDPTEILSPVYTRSILGNLNIKLGEHLYSTLRRPLLKVLKDTVGRHDLLFAACDPARYLEYGLSDHPNCKSNTLSALFDIGITPSIFPAPINLFMNVEVNPDGTTEICEPVSEPGDHIVLQSIEDLVIATSACPQDQNACNGFNPTDLRINIYDPESSDQS
ncbi:urea carboxylase-associated family protein [SAR202 cluster bacterium AD-804-J14_MRT_500m]|nr:urea carboxylase-associated family protein [SAR202 cluster bacterium AD-804-J14_MRT_500m]